MKGYTLFVGIVDVMDIMGDPALWVPLEAPRTKTLS
jgi:hypothetical protein